MYLNTPIRPDRTSQKRIIYTTKNNGLTDSQIEKQKNLWWAVHKEDHEICERLQEGRSSSNSNKREVYYLLIGKIVFMLFKKL